MSENTPLATPDNPAKIVVTGAAGRMGRMLVAAIAGRDDCVLVGATERPGGVHLGTDAGLLAGVGALGLPLVEDPAPAIAAANVVIDFTLPDAAEEHIRLAAQAGAALISGTTGLDAEQDTLIEKTSWHVPVVRAANFSTGVTLLSSLVGRAAALLDEDWDIEIVEMHHRHKVDAPSGTALALGQAAAAARKVEHDDRKQAVRDGHTGERRPGDIGYAVLRGGDVPGEHAVLFAGDGERIELSHKAGSRRIFANGAVRAALWAWGRKPGLYGMEDVLGLRDWHQGMNWPAPLAPAN